MTGVGFGVAPRLLLLAVLVALCCIFAALFHAAATIWPIMFEVLSHTFLLIRELQGLTVTECGSN